MNIHLERIYPTFQSREEVDAAINKLLGPGGIRLAVWKSKPALDADLRELIDKKYELLDIIKANNKLRADIGLEPTVYKQDDNLHTLRQLAGVDSFTPKTVAELDLDEKQKLFGYDTTTVIISNSIEKCRNHLEEFLKVTRLYKDQFRVHCNKDLKNNTELKQYYNRVLKNNGPIDNISSTVSTTIIYDNHMPSDLATNCRNIVLLDPNNDFSDIKTFMDNKQATYILDNPEETFSATKATEIYNLVEHNFYNREIYKDYCYNNLLVVRKTRSRQLNWKNYIYRLKYTTAFAPEPSTILSVNKLKEYIGKVAGDYKYGYNNYNDIGNYNTLLAEYTQIYSKQQQLVKKLYGVKPVEELENSCIKTLNNLVYQEQTRIVPRVIIGNSYMKSDVDGFSDTLYSPVEPPECCKKCYNSIYKCDCKCNVCGDANNLCYCLNSRVRNIHKSRPDLAVEANQLEDSKLIPVSTSTIVSVDYPGLSNTHKYIVGYTSKFNDSYRNTLMDLVSCLYEIDDMAKIKVECYSKSPDATTYKAIVKTYFSKQVSTVSSSPDFISNKLDMLLDHYKFLQENAIDTIQLAIEPKKTIETNTSASSDAKCDGNHISNGLKFNETKETYMTYCRSCHKSYTVNKPKVEPKIQYYTDKLEVDTSGFTNLSMSAILDLVNKANAENNNQFQDITTNSFSINRFMSSSSSSSSSKPNLKHDDNVIPDGEMSTTDRIKMANRLLPASNSNSSINTIEVTSYISVETYNIDIVYSLSEKKALVLVNNPSDIVKDICEGFPEFTYICGKNNVSATEKCEIEDKIHMVNFGSVDLVKNSLEELGQQQTSEAEKIKGYINANYTINDDVANRINATTLMETIAKGLGITIDTNKHGFTKRIAEYMDQLGCKKKRYSDGIYYYGLVPKN